MVHSVTFSKQDNQWEFKFTASIRVCGPPQSSNRFTSPELSATIIKFCTYLHGDVGDRSVGQRGGTDEDTDGRDAPGRKTKEAEGSEGRPRSPASRACSCTHKCGFVPAVSHSLLSTQTRRLMAPAADGSGAAVSVTAPSAARAASAAGVLTGLQPPQRLCYIIAQRRSTKEGGEKASRFSQLFTSLTGTSGR